VSLFTHYYEKVAVCYSRQENLPKARKTACADRMSVAGRCIKNVGFLLRCSEFTPLFLTPCGKMGNFAAVDKWPMATETQGSGFKRKG
jgi:hypothetical protein